MQIAEGEKLSLGSNEYVIHLDVIALIDVMSQSKLYLERAELEQLLLDGLAKPILREPSRNSRPRYLEFPPNHPTRLDVEYKLPYAIAIYNFSMPVGDEHHFLGEIAVKHNHKKPPNPNSARRWATLYRKFGPDGLLDRRRMKLIKIAGMRK